jgi:tetraacyldisaccharide 4'-kinase
MKRPWLAPLVPLYAAGVAWRAIGLRRGSRAVHHLRWPVVSIGNLSTGGSGKTPLTIALAKLLDARGVAVDILSRGYGRRGSEPARVDPAGTADQFGDEPVLIAREAGVPVYVASRRYDAGLLAEADANAEERASGFENGSRSNPQGRSEGPLPRVHILDDGFQHRQLSRSVDMLLFDRADFYDTLLPAGNLREPLRAAMRASVLAVPAGDHKFEVQLRTWGWQGPVWRLCRRMEVPVFTGPALAFCGLARPAQFFSGLKAAGIRISRSIAFPDHHRYTTKDAGRLDAAAKDSDALAMLTTEKDKVRLGELETRLPILSVGLRTEIEDEQAALDWLLDRVAAAESRSSL